MVVLQTVPTDDFFYCCTPSGISSSDNSVYYYITATDDGTDQAEPKPVNIHDNEHDQLGFVTDQLGKDLQYTPWPSEILDEGCEVTALKSQQIQHSIIADIALMHCRILVRNNSGQALYLILRKWLRLPVESMFP